MELKGDPESRTLLKLHPIKTIEDRLHLWRIMALMFWDVVTVVLNPFENIKPPSRLRQVEDKRRQGQLPCSTNVINREGRPTGLNLIRMVDLQLFEDCSNMKTRHHIRPGRTTTILWCCGLMGNPTTSRPCCGPMILGTASLHCCKHQHQDRQGLTKSNLATHVLNLVIRYTYDRHLTTEGQESSWTLEEHFPQEQCGLCLITIPTADHLKVLAMENCDMEKTAMNILLSDHSETDTGQRH